MWRAPATVDRACRWTPRSGCRTLTSAEDEVHAYVDGALDRRRRAEIDEHLAQCVRCAAEIEISSGLRSLIAPPAGGHGGTRGLAAAAVLALAAVLFGIFRAAPRADLARLNDGPAPLTVDRQGNVSPSDGMSPEEQVRVREALWPAAGCNCLRRC